MHLDKPEMLVDEAAAAGPAPAEPSRNRREAVFSFETENRRFTRVDREVPVEFKFFSSFTCDERLERTYAGSTSNLSGGGLLLACRVPDASWVPEMLFGKIVLGLKILLPGGAEPVKAMARVAWIEDPVRRGDPYHLGLTFREITREGHDRLLGFILDATMGG